MKAITILSLVALAATTAGCSKKPDRTAWWGPLLVKYVGTGPIVTDTKTCTSFMLDYRQSPPARIILTARPLGISTSPTQILRYEFPELTAILRKGQIPVTNELVALDIRNLLIHAHGPFFGMQDYLTEDVQRRDSSEWLLEDHYWGSPDDAHRVSMLIVHHVMTDSAGCFSNIVTDIHPREIHMEGQSKSLDTCK
jgi:hypothetical protein